MKKSEKVERVSQFTDRLGSAKAMIFAGYRGLKVAEMNELRSRLRKEQSQFKVLKNRLMKRALKEKGMGDLEQYVDGPTALATSEADPVCVAKVLVEFVKDHEKLEIKGGFLEGSILSAADIGSLARLPSRDVLLARALSCMQAPATNFAGVLAAVPRKLLYALNAIKETKQA